MLSNVWLLTSMPSKLSHWQVTSDRLEQSLKQPFLYSSPILFILFGSLIDVKLEQPSKQDSPNDIMPSCSVISESFLQSLKQCVGRLVIFVGRVIALIFLQSVKHPSPNVVMLLGSINVIKSSQRKYLLLVDYQYYTL